MFCWVTDGVGHDLGPLVGMKRPFVLIVFSVFFGGIYGSYECFYEFYKVFWFQSMNSGLCGWTITDIQCFNSKPLDNFGSSDLKVKLSETVWSFAGFFVRRLPAVCFWYLLVGTDFCQNSQLISVFIILQVIARGLSSWGSTGVKQLVAMNENAPGWLFSLNAFPLTFLWCAAFASLISCLLRLYGSFACGWYFSEWLG